MKNYIFMIFIGWLSAPMTAQNVDQFLVASGGGSNETLEWSVGEMVITTQTNTNQILTQGFHQTLLTITAIDEMAGNEMNFLIYPNPFRSTILIQQLNGSFQPLRFTLTDLSGQLILSESLRSASDEFNLESLASGIYFLNVHNADSSVRTFRIVKQN
ncbi:MAG: T9SS type A sorting domain-containing protein [Flavobacteriales bacterium]|nr:T9SS type A sorting domain-containing protein [Flavobacteriales bacterium]